MEIQVNNHFKDYLFDWKHRFYFIVGGYGSSKSYNTALKLVLKALTEPNRKILVTRAVFRTLKESCYDLIKEVIYMLEKDHLFKFSVSPLQITCSNGSRFLFLGLDDPAKLKSINGVSIIWCEEAPESKYNSFKELNGRLRTLNQSMHIILSSNPVSKNSWTYKHFFKEMKINDETLYEQRIMSIGETYYHHSTVEDNKFVPIEYIEQLDELKTHDPDLHRIARKGRFGTIGKKVLSNVESMKHSEMIEKIENKFHNHKYDGLDLGFTTSYNALVRCKVDIKNNYLYIYDEMYNKGLITSELISELNYIKNDHRQIRADNARPEIIEEIKRAGFRIVKCDKGPGSVMDGIQKIRSFKKVYISDKCNSTYHDLYDLCYFEDKDGEIVEDKFSFDSHALDGLRYSLEKYKHTIFKHGIIKKPRGV